MLRVAVVFLMLGQGLAADTCVFPGGNCWKLQMQTCKGNTTLSLHGLWPQWEEHCGKGFDISELSSIQSDLSTDWASCPEFHDSDLQFWQHEWETHGSCSGMDELTFFKQGLALRDKYLSTCETNAEECAVCLSKDFSTVQTCSGKTDTVPVETNKKMQARDSPCCITCESPKVKYYSVDTTHGHCGECCMQPQHYKAFKIFEPNLTLANGQRCSDLGYQNYDSTVTHGLGPVSMTLDLYDASGADIADTCVYPGGNCWRLQMQTCKGNTTLSLHGLWPQWKENCGEGFDISELSSIQSDLSTDWASCPEHHDTDQKFWQHEWETHGSCSGMDELTFFKEGLDLREKYLSTCDTNAEECAVCLSKDFSTVQTCSGKTDTVPEIIV